MRIWERMRMATRGRRATWIHAALAAILCAGAATASPATARAQAVIWRGRSAGYEITWTDGDVAARRVSDGATVFSARRMFDRALVEMRGGQDTDFPMTEYERRFTLLSVVGPIISLQDESYCDCGGAHPILSTRFVAYDLSRGTAGHPHEAQATDIVSERELTAALTADRLIRQAMAGAHVGTLSLRAMPSALKLQEIQPPNDECTYAMGESLPTSWAVHHLENGRVALRFSLSHDVEVCRGKFVQVGVLATPAARIAPDVRAADARRAGFLMKDARAIGGRRVTVLDWQRRKR